MARGTYYSEIENERLLKLWKNNEEKTYSEVAEMAIFYGISPGRSVNGVAQQISKLDNPPKDEEDAEQVEFDMTSMILEKENKDLRAELNSLLDTILETASLFNGYALHINYSAILKWLFKNEPERTSARIETLKIEEANNA